MIYMSLHVQCRSCVRKGNLHIEVANCIFVNANQMENYFTVDDVNIICSPNEFLHFSRVNF